MMAAVQISFFSLMTLLNEPMIDWALITTTRQWVQLTVPT
jgi:hypothetical protein